MSLARTPGSHYPCRGIDAYIGQDPLSGKEFIDVEVGFEDGSVGRKRFYLTTEGAFKFATKALRAMGCTFPDGDITNFAGFGTKDVEVTNEEQEYDGKVSVRVAFINAKALPLTQAATESFAQKFRAKLLMQNAKLGVALSESPQQTPRDVESLEPSAPPVDEDIPF